MPHANDLPPGTKIQWGGRLEGIVRADGVTLFPPGAYSADIHILFTQRPEEREKHHMTRDDIVYILKIGQYFYGFDKHGALAEAYPRTEDIYSPADSTTAHAEEPATPQRS